MLHNRHMVATNLDVRDDPVGGFYVPGLTEVAVKSVQETLGLLTQVILFTPRMLIFHSLSSVDSLASVELVNVIITTHVYKM